MKQLSKNQKGSSAIAGLLILLIVGIVSFVGWYVWSNRSTKDGTTTSTTTQTTPKPAECDADFKLLKNEKIGISLCYPKTWITKVVDTPNKYTIGTVDLTSPDYKDIEEAYGGSKQGTKVYVGVNKIAEMGDDYVSDKSIQDGLVKRKGASYILDVQAVKIAGQNGVSYITSYEGPQRLYNQFEYNGNQYYIALEQDVDGPKFNDNADDYQKLVDSFEILN